MWFSRRRAPLGDAESDLGSLEALIREADIARDSGNAEAAVTRYTEAVARAPDRNDIKIQLGNMLKDVGRLRDADAMYGRAQEADPDDADVCVQRGHTRKLMGDRNGALAQYRRAVALAPEAFSAAEELAEVGSTLHQQQRFEVNFRNRGSEAILTMSRQLAAMRLVLDDIASHLPEALGHAAIPVESYEVFAGLHQPPGPPPGPRAPVTVSLPFDREAPATLQAQLAALRAQTSSEWTVLAIGGDAGEQREIVERAAIADARFRLVAPAPGETVAAAEWRAARGVAAGGVLVLLAPGAMLHPQALAWAGALPGLGEAEAFVCDEDHAVLRRGGPVHSAPVLRPVVDHDTLLDANVFGETIAVSATAYGRLTPQAPDASLARARGSLLLELAREGNVAHVPYVLVSRLDDSRPSLPEHRAAVEAHAARHGFAERIVVAKGDTGPTHWRPRQADAGITVVIPTRDNAHDLRLFIHSLRSLAAQPDHLRFVIVENGTTLSETRAILDDLAAKRYVSLLAEAPPFNWSRSSNVGARAADTPIVVFANDDMAMQTENWDDRLRGYLDRDEVGAVGARLLYPDHTVQHAGILFGWKGMTIHDGLYAGADEPGPARRLQVTRATSAVTGAFLATRRDRFEAVGGFDEVELPVVYGDVDFCLKLRRAGQRILWTPAITLRHDESKTRGMRHLVPTRANRDAAELATMEARWGAAFDREPALNPVWATATTPFRLLIAPAEGRAIDHIRLTGRRNPWGVDAPTDGARNL